MASDSRFYQLELRHRPALHGDVGSLLKIEGLVIGGEGAQAVFMLPETKFSAFTVSDDGETVYHRDFNLTMEEWTDWLRRSDDPEILVQGSLEKIFHRKLRYEISGAVQQKVWMADGCRCMYCFRPMGEVQLTVDHFTPLEMGGKNDTGNYLSACRKCNKEKGGMAPADWIARKMPFFGVPYGLDWYTGYLENRKLP